MAFFTRHSWLTDHGLNGHLSHMYLRVAVNSKILQLHGNNNERNNMHRLYCCMHFRFQTLLMNPRKSKILCHSDFNRSVQQMFQNDCALPSIKRYITKTQLDELFYFTQTHMHTHTHTHTHTHAHNVSKATAFFFG
jgi:hypothetical protein